MTLTGTVYNEMKGAMTLESAANYNYKRTLAPGSVIGNAAGRKEGKVTGTTGVIKIDDYYAYYEETLGIIYMAYGSNTTGCASDTYVFVK